MDFASMLGQTVTYWPAGTPDGYGKLNFADVVPVVLSCRWQNISVLFRDAQGRDAVSQAIVYLTDVLTLGGYLAQGNVGAVAGSDPRRISGAFEIRHIGTSPSLRADEVLYKVML